MLFSKAHEDAKKGMAEHMKKEKIENETSMSKYIIVFYNRFACQTQIFHTEAKNKHVARHNFWKEYPRKQMLDCIESIYEA